MTVIMVDLMGTIPPPILLQHARGQFGYSGHNRAKCPPVGYGAELVAAGGLYAIVFEDSATRATQGYQAGRDDAVFANRDADQQGYPVDCTIFATADFDATPTQIADYVHGFHDGSKRPIGLYADGDCIRAFKAKGWVRYGWLTCSGGFHGSHDSTGIDLYQRCAGESGQISIPGYSIDTNYVYGFIAAWGQTPNTPTPAPTPGGPLMALTDAQQAELLSDVQASKLILEQLQHILLGDNPKLGDTQQRELASLARLEAKKP